MAPNNETTKVNHTSPQSTAKKAHVSNTERTNTCTACIKIILTFCLLAVFLDCLRSLSLGFLVIELMCSVALSIYLWFGKEKLVATRLHVDSINLKYLQQFSLEIDFKLCFAHPIPSIRIEQHFSFVLILVQSAVHTFNRPTT